MDGAWRRPTDSSLRSGTPSLGEVPSGGARAFCLLLRFSKVSRRQGGTLGGRYRRNGYVLGIAVSPIRPPSRASPLPQFDCGVSGRLAWAGRPPSQASQLPQLIVGCQVDWRRLVGRLRSDAATRQARSHIWISERQMDMRRLSGRHGSKLPRHRFSVAPKLCGYLYRD